MQLTQYTWSTVWRFDIKLSTTLKQRQYKVITKESDGSIDKYPSLYCLINHAFISTCSLSLSLSLSNQVSVKRVYFGCKYVYSWYLLVGYSSILLFKSYSWDDISRLAEQ